MINVEQDNIYRVTIKNTQNEQGESVFTEGTILHCVYSNNKSYLATPLFSTDLPRLVFHKELRELNSEEKKRLPVSGSVVEQAEEVE